MLCFFNRLIENKNHSRKNSYTADNTDYNSFCTDNTKIAAKCECHKTKCGKTSNCCNRASHDRLKGIGDCMTHRTLPIIWETFFIFLIAAKKENGIIHCNTELKNSYKCLCNIGNLSKECIRSHVVENRYSDT